MVWSEAIDLLKSTDGSAEKKLPTQQAVKFETGGKKKLTSGEGFPLPGQSIAAPKKETVTERPPLNVRISKILQNEAVAKKKAAADYVKRGGPSISAPKKGDDKGKVVATYEKPKKEKPSYGWGSRGNWVKPVKGPGNTVKGYEFDVKKFGKDTIEEAVGVYVGGKTLKVLGLGAKEAWSLLPSNLRKEVINQGGKLSKPVLNKVQQVLRKVDPKTGSSKKRVTLDEKGAAAKGVPPRIEPLRVRSSGRSQTLPPVAKTAPHPKPSPTPTVDEKALGLAETKDAALARTLDKVTQRPGWRNVWSKELKNLKDTTDLRTKGVSPSMIEGNVIPKWHYKKIQELAGRALKKKYPKGEGPGGPAYPSPNQQQAMTNEYADFYYKKLSEYLTEAIKHNGTYQRNLQSLPQIFNKSWVGALDILKSIDERRTLFTRINSFSASWHGACDLLKADATEEVPWKAENRRAYRLAQHSGDKFVPQQRGVSKITGEKVFTDSRVIPLKTRPASEETVRPSKKLIETPKDDFDALRIYRAKNPHTGKTLKQELIDAYKDNPDARPTGQAGSIPSWNEKYSRRSGGFLKKYSDPKVSKKAAHTVKEPYPVSLEGFDFAPGQSAVVGTKKIPKWVERARLRYQQKLYRTAMRKSHHDMEKSWGIVMTDNWNGACDLLKSGPKKDSRLERAGVEGYNKPKRTPKHPTKSHIVVAKEGERVKTIRFGEQGAETNQTVTQRESFKARHRKNIKRGRMSAAYWADKVKWNPAKTENQNKSWSEANDLLKSVEGYSPSPRISERRS